MQKLILLLICIGASLFCEERSRSSAKNPQHVPTYIARGPSDLGLPNGTEIPVKRNGKILLEVIPQGEPFLTGPLLASSGHTVPYGHMNLESYVFVNSNIGYYNNRWHLHRYSTPQDNINFQYLVQSGISDFMDFSFAPQFFYNYTGSRSNYQYGDFGVQAGFQVHQSTYDSWIPTIKFGIGELFPTGRYEALDFAELGTDIGGGGSFVTFFKLAFSDLWYLGRHHFLALRFSNQWFFSSPVKVHGLNAYGGDDTTIGTVKPGISYTGIVAGEITLTKHWALACDLDFTYAAPTKFKGTTLAFVGKKQSSYLLSLAPAIEYNFTSDIGMIGGLWFTLTGDNSPVFYNWVFAFNWFFP